MIYTVILSRRVEKQLMSLPRQVSRKLLEWTDAVELDGLEAIRRISGYHDEPLKGSRAGQRSIRLNRFYRAIYVIASDGGVEVALVEEVTKHEY